MENGVMALLRELIHIDSESQSVKERDIEAFLLGKLKAMPGVTAQAIGIKDDPYGRSIVYGFVSGQTKETVIFLNHHDVVGVAPYGVLAKDAFSPDELKEDLLHQERNAEVLADLESGEWLVGRGSCDMKGGMAAQLVVFREYAAHPGKASLLFLSIPDEESYSAGMRAAMPLLQSLQQTYGFHYRIVINSEPSPQEDGKLVAYTGSVGKILPVIVVQGKPVHVGNYAEGLNPIGILARIVAATEGNMALADRVGEEMTPPPAWMYFRDRKKRYDVSLPYRAAGWMNVLTYEKTPADILQLLKDEAAKAVEASGTDVVVQIMTGAELLEIGKKTDGFDVLYEHLYHQSMLALTQGTSSYAEETISMIAHLLAFLHVTEPTIVIAFAPPFYPAAQSTLLHDTAYDGLLQAIAETAPVTYKQYFNGISDCSYCCLDGRQTEEMLQGNLLLWGDAYPLQFQTMAELKIPFLLLGPWGKDLHERTERVNIASVSEELPKILRHVVEYIGNHA